jgi:phenylacetate-CoA ligase
MHALKAILRKCQAVLKPVFDREYAAGMRWHATCRTQAPDDLRALQSKQLVGLVKHFVRVGLYELPEQLGSAMLAESGYLPQLPILTRGGLRDLFPRLARHYQDRRDVYRHLTSGATAEPVEFLHSRLMQRRTGGCNLGMYRLMGWRPGMKRLCLWGNYRDLGLEERQQRGLKGRLLKWLASTRRFGGFTPDEAEYERFINAVRDSPGSAIFGFASLMEDCARWLIRRGDVLPPGHLATAWTCSEPVTDAGRKVMEQAFNVPVREHYGSRECASIATECDHGSLHINPRYIIEVVGYEDGQPCAPGITGKLLITDLFNDATPLIRYQIGDLGAVEWRDCACGWRGPCLIELAGRITDLIVLPSGRRTPSTTFMVVLQDIDGIHQFRTYRRRDQEFEVNYTGRMLDEPTVTQTEQLLSDVLEGAAVRLVHVPEIDRSPAGKLIQYVDLTGNGAE